MKKSTLRNLLLTALFAALTAAGTILRIGECSLQTLFSVLSGLLLGPVWGPVSQLLYFVLGLTGLPMFIYGGGLLYAVEQPTFGYLLGMILSSFVSGILTEKTDWNIWIVSALGLLSVYLIGTPYAYFYFLHRGAEALSFGTAVTMSFLVFVPIDIFKLFAVALIGKRLMPVLRKDLYEY